MWFGLKKTRFFSVKQGQSSSRRSAEHSSIGFIITQGTVPDQRVRILLMLPVITLDRSLAGAVFLLLPPPLGFFFRLNPNLAYFCTEFTAVDEIQSPHPHSPEKRTLAQS